MSTEYRFSLTPRLVALALFGIVALMVLLFALGYQVGRGMAPHAREAGERVLHKAEQEAEAAVSPLQKAMQ